jgi:molecular chaperone GrpE
METLAQKKTYHLLPQADLAGEIEGLREDLRNERDRHLRTLADFKNYRRRVERDGNKIAEDGNREVFRSLLNIVDDLDNAVRWSSHGEQALVKGVPIIHKKLVALLEAHGVRPFDSAGMQFTPDLHQAVAVTKLANAEPGTIVEVLRRGYLWKDELLRPAQVQVAE